MEQHFTINEVAARLKVNHKLVRKLIKTRELTAYKVGTVWRIPESSINAYLEAHIFKNEKTPLTRQQTKKLRSTGYTRRTGEVFRYFPQ